MNNEWKKVSVFIVGILGVISSIIQLLTSNFSITSMYIGVGLLIVTAVVAIVVFYVIPKDNLPSGIEVLAEELQNNKSNRKIKIVFPCDSAYYKAANKLAKEKFGKNSVSTRTVDDWKKRNEFILTCLSDDNKLVGYFDILPLKNDFAYKLISGELSEKDTRAEHLLSVHEMKDAEYIYFAGIAVQNTELGVGCIHGTYLVYAAILYIKQFYANSNLKKILTIPTSECGLKIAKHLDFCLEREGKLRKDGFDLYSKEFSLSEIDILINEKKRLYRRFDSSAYHNTFQKLLRY